MDKTKKTTEEIAYTLVIPRQLHTRLKTMCASEEISIKNYLTALIELDLQNHVLPLTDIQK